MNDTNLKWITNWCSSPISILISHLRYIFHPNIHLNSKCSCKCIMTTGEVTVHTPPWGEPVRMHLVWEGLLFILTTCIPWCTVKSLMSLREIDWLTGPAREIRRFRGLLGAPSIHKGAYGLFILLLFKKYYKNAHNATYIFYCDTAVCLGLPLVTGWFHLVVSTSLSPNSTAATPQYLFPRFQVLYV